MKKLCATLRRPLAFLLAVMMVLSTLEGAIVAVSAAGATIKPGQVLTSHFDMVDETAVLLSHACVAVDGAQQTIDAEPPADEDEDENPDFGVVVEESDGSVVAPVVETEDGNLWVPVKAVVTDNSENSENEPVEITNDSAEDLSFECDEIIKEDAAYSVVVTYELWVANSDVYSELLVLNNGLVSDYSVLKNLDEIEFGLKELKKPVAGLDIPADELLFQLATDGFVQEFPYVETPGEEPVDAELVIKLNDVDVADVLALLDENGDEVLDEEFGFQTCLKEYYVNNKLNELNLLVNGKKAFLGDSRNAGVVETTLDRLSTLAILLGGNEDEDIPALNVDGLVQDAFYNWLIQRAEQTALAYLEENGYSYDSIGEVESDLENLSDAEAALIQVGLDVYYDKMAEIEEDFSQMYTDLKAEQMPDGEDTVGGVIEELETYLTESAPDDMWTACEHLQNINERAAWYVHDLEIDDFSNDELVTLNSAWKELKKLDKEAELAGLNWLHSGVTKEYEKSAYTQKINVVAEGYYYGLESGLKQTLDTSDLLQSRSINVDINVAEWAEDVLLPEVAAQLYEKLGDQAVKPYLAENHALEDGYEVSVVSIKEITENAEYTVTLRIAPNKYNVVITENDEIVNEPDTEWEYGQKFGPLEDLDDEKYEYNYSLDGEVLRPPFETEYRVSGDMEFARQTLPRAEQISLDEILKGEKVDLGLEAEQEDFLKNTVLASGALTAPEYGIRYPSKCPEELGKLVKVNGNTVTADSYPSGLGDAMWEPTYVEITWLDGTPGTMDFVDGQVVIEDPYQQIVVNYELDVTNALEAEDVEGLLNLANDIAEGYMLHREVVKGQTTSTKLKAVSNLDSGISAMEAAFDKMSEAAQIAYLKLTYSGVFGEEDEVAKYHPVESGWHVNVNELGEQKFGAYLNQLAAVNKAETEFSTMVNFYRIKDDLVETMELVRDQMRILLADEAVYNRLAELSDLAGEGDLYSKVAEYVGYVPHFNNAEGEAFTSEHHYNEEAQLPVAINDLKVDNKYVDESNGYFESLLKAVLDPENQNKLPEGGMTSGLTLSNAMAPIAGRGYMEVAVQVQVGNNINPETGKVVLKWEEFDPDDLEAEGTPIALAQAHINDLIGMVNDLTATVSDRKFYQDPVYSIYAGETLVYSSEDDAVADLSGLYVKDLKAIAATMAYVELAVQVENIQGDFGTLNLSMFGADGKSKVTIELPGSGDPAVVREYELNGISLGSAVGEDTVKAELDKADFEKLMDGAVIRYTETNKAIADLEAFQKDTAANDSAVVLDQDGAYTIVVSTNGFRGFAEALIKTYDESTVQLPNGETETLHKGMTLHLQTVIDMFLNSGLDTDQMLAILGGEGQQVTAKESEIFGASQANEGIAVVSEDKTLNLGSKLLSIPVTLKKGNIELPVNLCVTMDAAIEQLQAIRDIYERFDNIGFELENGALNGYVSIPEDFPVYDAYMALLVLDGATGTGKDGNTITASFDNLDQMGQAIALSYLYNDVLKGFVDENTTIDTYNNTISKVEQLTGKDLLPREIPESYEGIDFEALHKRFATLVAETDPEFVNNKIEGNIEVEANKIVNVLCNMLGLPDISSLVYECQSEENKYIQIGLSAELRNADRSYEALVIDSGAGMEMIKLSQDVVGAAKNMSNAGMVMLVVDELEKDLVFNQDTVLDLNGNTVKGSIKANGKLVIVDSSVGGDGYVTGTVSGNVTILGGNYDANVNAYLPEGYVCESGRVSNVVFDVVDDGENVTVTINVAKDTLGRFTNPTSIATLAAEVLADLVMNHNFNAGYYVNIDGNAKKVFDIQLNHILGEAEGVDSKLDAFNVLVNTLIGGNGYEGWIDESAMADIVNYLVAQLLDFENMAEAVDGDGTFFEMSVTRYGWDIEPTHVYENGEDYLDLNVGSRAEGETFNVKFVLNVESSAVQGGLEKLAEIIRVDKAFELDIEDIVYDNNKNFEIGGSYTGKMTIDLNGLDNTNEAYVNTIAVLLANNATGAEREKWIDAINAPTYVTLKELINSTTVEELMDAVVNAGTLVESGVIGQIYDDLIDTGRDAKAIAESLKELAKATVNVDRAAFEQLYTELRNTAEGEVAQIKELVVSLKDLSNVNMGLVEDIYNAAIDAGDTAKAAAEKAFDTVKACFTVDRDALEALAAEIKATGLDAVAIVRRLFAAFKNTDLSVKQMAKDMGVLLAHESMLTDHKVDMLIEALAASWVAVTKAADKYDVNIPFLKGTLAKFEDGDSGVYVFSKTASGDWHPTIKGISLDAEFDVNDLTFNLELFPVDSDCEHPEYLWEKVEAVDPTCTTEGNIEYYTCGNIDCTAHVYFHGETKELISFANTKVPALGHTEGVVVVENEVAADCVNGGSYDEVVYCTVCGEELSRKTITVEALGHTEGAVVVENEVAADCVNGGSYDNVVYCTVCGEELSRETVTVEALGHTAGEVVVENNVAPDCENDGSYDNVVYCTVCGEELTRETVTVEALGHTEGEVVVENNVDPDCVNEGSYDNVVYCTVCDEELSRETVTVPALGHTAGEVVVENNVAPDCENDGSYDNVVYCTVCGEELSRETVTVPALGHTAGEVVVENNVAPDCENDGSYDNVVYCTVCGEELSRETITVPALGHIVDEDSYDHDGLHHYNKCEVCGERIESTKEDHYYGEGDHSCDDVQICEICGYVKPQGDHVVDPENDVIYTWAADYSSVHILLICPTCKEVLVDQDVATEIVATKPASCGVEGYVKYQVQLSVKLNGVDVILSDERQQTIPALDHNVIFVEKGEEVCDGEWIAVDHWYCIRCGKFFEDEACTKELSRDQVYKTATGNHVVATKVVAATCTSAGYTLDYCERCGEIIKAYNPVEPSHLKVRADKVVAPSCTEQGYTVYTCAACGESWVSNYTNPVGHKMPKDWTTDVKATCQNEGQRSKTCENGDCGYTIIEKVQATGHNMVAGNVVDPTCAEAGYTVYECANGCGYTFKGDYVAATGNHDYSNNSVEQKPTCTEQGSIVSVCKVCGYNDVVITPALGHDYGHHASGNCTGNNCETVDGTCAQEGYTEHKCLTCGESYRDQYNKVAHDYANNDVVTPATCETMGYTTHTCNDCGHSYVDSYTAALGHDFDQNGDGVFDLSDGKEHPASHTEMGYYTFTCIRCDYSYNDNYVSADPDAHNFVATQTVEPTCTEMGYTVMTCEHCGYSYYTAYVEALGHRPWEKKHDATCTEDGYTEFICVRGECGYSYKSDYVAAEHSFVDRVEVPSCYRNGYTEHTCQVCNYTYKDQYTAANNEHAGFNTEQIAATCTERGYTLMVCVGCGYSYKHSYINATGHDYTNLEPVTPPTCETMGYTTHTCRHCGYSYVDSYTAALGHSFTNYVSDNNATCAADGTKTAVCDNGCNEKHTVVDAGSMVEHDFGSAAAYVVEKTCTTAGYDVHQCVNCGCIEYRNVVDPSHNWGSPTVKNPTCTEQGYTEKVCGDCGYVERSGFKPAEGHDYVVVEQKVATHTEMGYTIHECTRCYDRYCDNYVSLDPNAHKYEEQNVDATCSEQGYTVFTCEYCGHSYIGNYTNPIAHDFNAPVEQEATCTSGGYVTKTCKNCGLVEYVEYLDPKDHDMSGWTVTVPATCEASGVERNDCKNCDHFEERAVAQKNHEMTVLVSSVPATCTSVGYEVYKCVNCAHTEQTITEAIKSHNYDWDGDGVRYDDAVVVAPTCTEKGHTTYTCKDCGYTMVSYQDATGHDMSAWTVALAAKCGVPGVERSDCADCDHFETRGVAALDHDFEVVVTDPTCVEQGYTTHTCKLCYYSEVDSYTAETGAHDYDEVVVPATCTTNGYTVQICKVCGCRQVKAGSNVNANGHGLPVSATVIVPATCVDQGMASKACANCDYVEITVIPATAEHAYADTVVPASCTATGYTVHTCTVCGYSYNDTFVDVLDHTYTESVVVEPVCGVAGLKVITCTACGHSCEEGIAPLKHVYKAGERVEPTYDKAGYQVYTCELCNDSYKEIIPALTETDHKYQIKVHVDATCTEQGYTTYGCEICGDTYTVYKPAAGHDFKHDKNGDCTKDGKCTVQKPTCTEAGYTTHTCSVCGYTYKDSITTAEHKWKVSATVPATCNKAGYILHACETCGESYKEIIPALTDKDHEYKVKVEVAATCTEQGYTTYGCDICGDTYTKYTAATGHDYKHDKNGDCTKDGKCTVQKPTCTDLGYTTHTCVKCGYSYTDSLVNPAHKYTEKVVKPTCTAAGYTLYTCSVCGHSYRDKFTTADHKWKETASVPATCTEAGYKQYTCETCGESYKEIIPALTDKDHDYKVKVEVAATCTEQGSTTYGCDICGDTYTVYTAATGHDFKHDKDGNCTKKGECTVQKATCTEPGYTTHTCVDCGYSYTDTYVDPAHQYTDEVTKPSCHEDGYTTHTCSVCGHSYKDDYVPAEGHGELVHVPAKDNTCTEPGNVEYWYCPDCGEIYLDADGNKASTEKGVTVPAGCELQHFAEKAATCTENGNIEHWFCEGCNKYYLDKDGTKEAKKDQVVIKGGHDMTYVPEDRGNCFIEGVMEYWKCSKCEGVFVKTPGGKYTEVEMDDLYIEPHCCDTTEENCDALVLGMTDVVPYPMWYHNHIDCIIDRKIMNGMSATTFEPDRSSTRAMIVTMIYRMECERQGVEPGELEYSYHGGLKDITGSEWYADAAKWAFSTGVMKGVTQPDGTLIFDGDGTITREMLAAFLYRYVYEIRNIDTVYNLETRKVETVKLNDLSSFSDNAKVADWAEAAMQWAVGTGVINGMTETTLEPQTNASRAQIATMFHRMIELIVEPSEK